MIVGRYGPPFLIFIAAVERAVRAFLSMLEKYCHSFGAHGAPYPLDFYLAVKVFMNSA
ncbi:MAG: hypothetical protein ACXV8U_18010 [Methylobacter sp.]